MNGEAWDVDTIVREVLRRLQPPTPASVAAPPSAAPPPAVQDRRELRIAERVVTLAVLEGRLQGVQRLAVDPRAVITPSVWDLLRKQNVAIVRQAVPCPQVTTSGDLLVVIAETSFDPAELAAQLGCRPERAETLAAAIDRLTEQVRGQARLGALITDNGMLALCAANRRRGIRAALGASREAARQAVRTLGANLLVVDPAGQTVAELTGTLREFAKGGPRECPRECRQMLEAT